MSSRRTTRSATRSSTFQTFVTDILPIIIGQEDGCWIDVADVASIQATCTGANKFLSSQSANQIWGALAKREWPDITMVDGYVAGGGLPDGNYENFRELYVDYPRVWLTIEAAKIKTSPKWTTMQHIGRHGNLECGKCGCNCGNGSGECPGIPIESEYRYDRRERLGYYEARAYVSRGEGYQMSGGSMVALNHFCEPCFELMLELQIQGIGGGGLTSVSRDDYDKVAGTNIFDETKDYVVNEEGIDSQKKAGCYYSDPYFRDCGGIGYSWQKNLGVSTDDAAVVIAHALIDPNCSHKHLNIDGLHFNEKWSERAYKAFAYALSINTSLRTLSMSGWERWGEGCCNDGWDEVFFNRNMKNDVWSGFDPFQDQTNGMFIKALKHNRSHNIFRMNYCSCAFGVKTESMIKALLKPRPTGAEADDEQEESSKRRKR